MRHFVLIASCLSAVAMPAFAADAPAKPEQTQAKIVCKSQPETGTRFRKKTCHSVAEWDAIAEENRRAAAEMNGPAVNGARGN